MIRQGDVNLYQAKSIVDVSGLKKAKSKVPGRVVLAYGEVTGHHHSIDANLWCRRYDPRPHWLWLSQDHRITRRRIVQRIYSPRPAHDQNSA